MNSKNLTNYYIWAIKALVFVIPFLSLWISTSMFFPYITGRNFAFRILVEIALVFWVGLMIANKEYRPKLTPIVWAVLIFAVVIGVADFLGVDSYASFWSRLERMEGYLMILHITAYFLILTSVFRTKKDWLVFFNLFVIAGILAGGYGVLQLLGLKAAIQGGGVRIDGTIGNPTYLAAYLTLIIAVALILFFNAEKTWLKYFYGASILFSFIIMYFTATRGAALALLIAIPIFLILYLALFRGADAKEKLFRKLAVAALILIVVVPTLVWFAKDTSLVKNSEVLSRLTSVSFGEKTIKSRIFIWGIAWKAFQERPVLGWGQENFLQAFSKYYDPRLYDQEPWFDRPHNIIFEWLIDGGIIGLLSYLALFVSLFWGIGKLLRKNLINKKEGIVLIVVPIAYFLQNFFVFDNFNTYVLFFGLLAYVNSLITERAAVSEQKDSSQISLASLIGGLVLMSVVIYFVNIKPIQAAQGIINGLSATGDPNNPIQKTLDTFKQTLSYNTFADGEAVEQLSRTAALLIGRGNMPNSAKIPFLLFSIQELEKYSKEFPKNVRIHLMLGSLYQASRAFNPQLILKAREHIQAALDLSPNKQQILFLMADNHLLTNEVDKAMGYLQKAVELEPSYRDAHIDLAIIAIITNRNDLVEEQIKELSAVRLNSVDKKIPQAQLWNYINDLNRIADVYLQAGKPQGAKAIYNKIAVLKPEIEAFNLPKDLTEPYEALLQNLADRIRE